MTQLPNSSKHIRRYFGTDGIRGRVGEWPINAEFILKLGWAVGKILATGNTGKVLIGKDTRISGYMFESVLEAGLSSAGIDIHLLGPMPTPAIAYLTRTLRAQAGIVISASHNPYYDNGIKFFSSQGTKLPDEIEMAIEEQLEKPMTTVDSSRLGKATRIVDAPGRYIEFCKSTVASHVTFNGLKLVVDCANGAAYHIAPNVFRELGADVIEIGTDPNGLNINLNCGATSLASLQQRVLQEKADVGIALDGDGDRLMMVDHQGNIFNGDAILSIIVQFHKNAGLLNGGVVGTVMSNIGLEWLLSDLKVPFIRVPVGDRHIIAELLKRQWSLGGEPSGHLICSNSITTGDGILTALQVLSAMHHTHKTLSELLMNFRQCPQVLINIPMAQPIDLASKPRIQKVLQDVEKELGNAGRVLLRRSGTEPLIRIMVEGENKAFIEQLANRLANVVEEELTL